MIKIARWLGIITSASSMLLYISLLFRGAVTFPIFAMIVLNIIGAIVSFFSKPYLMFIVSLLSFFPVGYYIMGTPSIYSWVGIFNLIFLFATFLLLAGK